MAHMNEYWALDLADEHAAYRWREAWDRHGCGSAAERAAWDDSHAAVLACSRLKWQGGGFSAKRDWADWIEARRWIQVKTKAADAEWRNEYAVVGQIITGVVAKYNANGTLPPRYVAIIEIEGRRPLRLTATWSLREAQRAVDSYIASKARRDIRILRYCETG